MKNDKVALDALIASGVSGLDAKFKKCADTYDECIMYTFDKYPCDPDLCKIDGKLIADSEQILETSGYYDGDSWDEALFKAGEPQKPMDLSKKSDRKKAYTKQREYFNIFKSANEEKVIYPTIDEDSEIMFKCGMLFDNVGAREWDSYEGYGVTAIKNPIKDSSTGETQHDAYGSSGIGEAMSGLDGAFSAYEDAVARRNNLIIGLAVGGAACLCCCIGGIVFCCMKMNKKDETPIVVQPVNPGQNQSATEMVPGQGKM